MAFKGDDVSFECAAKGYPLEVEWKVKKKNEETVEACISKFCRIILFLFFIVLLKTIQLSFP